MEILAYRGLRATYDFEVRFWRTKTGLEVDFILGDAEICIEVKINEHIDKTDLKGLFAFKKDYPSAVAYLVCQVPKKRRILLENGGFLTVIPWSIFLKDLWDNKIIKNKL